MTTFTARKGAFKDPTTKANLLDRINSRDFSGDLADLAVNRDLRYERTRPAEMLLKFGDSGNVFELVVRKPRTEEALAKMRSKREGAEIGKKPSRRKQTPKAAAEGSEIEIAPAAAKAKRSRDGQTPSAVN